MSQSTSPTGGIERPLSDRFARLFLSIASIIENDTLVVPSPASSLITTTTMFPSNVSTFPEYLMDETMNFHVPVWVYILMSTLYACIFALGITGNLLVILVIARDRRMRNTANFYLISLSLADLMIITFCLPVAVYELHAEEVWSLGPILCKLAPLLQYLSTNASISTMVAISIERYLVVCRPLKIRTYCTKTRACGLIVILWLFSLACSSPVLYFTVHEAHYHHKLRRMVYVCYINHFTNEAYFYFHQACFYALPGVLLSFLYSQIVLALRRFKSERFGNSPDSRKNIGPGSKAQSDTRQLIIMLSAVVLSYFVCLLPYNCITFLSLISTQTLLNLGPLGYNVFLAVSRIMFFINSCSNPIMYNAISGKFRDAFKKFFCPGRYKHRGIDSRTMSARSTRGIGADEDLISRRRMRTGMEHTRLDHTSSSRTLRGMQSASIIRGSSSDGISIFSRATRTDSNSRGGRKQNSAKSKRSGVSEDGHTVIRAMKEKCEGVEIEL